MALWLVLGTRLQELLQLVPPQALAMAHSPAASMGRGPMAALLRAPADTVPLG